VPTKGEDVSVDRSGWTLSSAPDSEAKVEPKSERVRCLRFCACRCGSIRRVACQLKYHDNAKKGHGCAWRVISANFPLS
jgi:hypothetical protein